LIGREPSAIWQDSLEDGQRRLERPAQVLAATGLLGGFHIAFGLLALVVTTGALATLMPPYPAHVLASLTFGIAFVFVTIGRSELFTENFLIPVAAVGTVAVATRPQRGLRDTARGRLPGRVILIGGGHGGGSRRRQSRVNVGSTGPTCGAWGRRIAAAQDLGGPTDLNLGG